MNAGTLLRSTRAQALVPGRVRYGLAGVAAGRAALLPVAALCSILTLRLVSTSVGVRGFAAVSLVATLPSLIPLGDLGVGASITDAVARYKTGDALDGELTAVIRSSLRVLVVAGLVGALLAVLAPLFFEWRTLLGGAMHGVSNLAITTALLLWIVSLPLAVGQRMLLSFDRRALFLVAIALPAPTTLLFAVIGAAFDFGPSFFVATSTVGLLTAAGVSTLLAVRCGPSAFRMGFSNFAKRERGVPLRSTAGPMAIISVALPIAYQSDRLLLSHLSTPSEVAIYSAGAQFFAPALAIVSVTGQFLWPRFASARAKFGEVAARTELLQVWKVAGAAGLVGASAFGLSLSFAVRMATADRVSVSALVSIGFATTLALHAVYYPLGMYLTSRAGLRFQAVSSVAMCVLNVALSLLLARKLGAAGPVLASACAITVCMLAPACVLVYSGRDRTE